MYAYCLEMLRFGADDDLARLEAYFFGNDPDPADTDLIWRSGEFRLFVSHISAEKVFAKEFAHHVESFGVHAFVAHEDIEPNSEWLQVILNSLRTSEALVALLQPGFHESRWTDQEVGYVLGRSRPVLSVRLGQEPYGFFGMQQGLPGFGKQPSNLAVDVVNVLLASPRTADSMKEAIVGRLERSRSWNTTNNIISLLKRHPPLSASHYQRLRAAQTANYEVGNAFEVEPYLESIKHLYPAKVPVYGDEEPF
jgi:hypothetical protein